MTPRKRAEAAMAYHFREAGFDPEAYGHIADVMTKAIKEAIAEDRQFWVDVVVALAALATVGIVAAGLRPTPVPCGCRPVEGKACECCAGCRGRN